MPAKTAPSMVNSPKFERRRDEREAEEQVDAVVDEEDLHEERRAAEDEHVEPGQPAQRKNVRHPHECGEEAEDDTQDLRGDRDVDGGQERPKEDVVGVEQPFPDDVPVDRQQASGAPFRSRYFFSRTTAFAMPHLATIFFIEPLA